MIQLKRYRNSGVHAKNLIQLKHLFFFILLVIATSAIDSYAQMTVKNSLDQTVMQIEQNGRVAVGTTADLLYLPKLYIQKGNIALDIQQSISSPQFIPANQSVGALKLFDSNGNTILSNKYIDGGTGGNIQFTVADGTTSPIYAMNIAKSGNVGIGTTSPATKLHIGTGGVIRVAGMATTGNKVVLANASGDLSALGVGTTAQYLRGDGTWQVPPSGSVGGSGTATRVAFWSGTAGAASTTLSSNANLYWDNTNSRLGIGQTNPSGSLGIASNTGNELHVSGTETANIYSQGILDLATGSGSAIQMRSGASATANFYLNPSGNIGIGNSAPSAPLHITRGAQTEVLRLDGITASTSNTRLLTVDNSGNVRYRDASSLSTGHRIDDADIVSHYLATAYEVAVKTHDYLEMFLITSAQNDGDDGGVDEDDDGGWNVSHLTIEKWNGSSWVATPYYAERSVYAQDDDISVNDKFYLQWTLSDAEIPDMTLIRFKLWCTNPYGQNYHNSADVIIRYWSHDGGHLSQAILNTL